MTAPFTQGSLPSRPPGLAAVGGGALDVDTERADVGIGPYGVRSAMVHSTQRFGAGGAAPAPHPHPAPARRVPQDSVTLIADSVEMMADEDGYAQLGEVANLLVRKKRDFDPRNFGFSKLSKLVKALPRFEVDVRQGSQPNATYFFVRDKEGK